VPQFPFWPVSCLIIGVQGELGAPPSPSFESFRFVAVIQLLAGYAITSISFLRAARSVMILRSSSSDSAYEKVNHHDGSKGLCSSSQKKARKCMYGFS